MIRLGIDSLNAIEKGISPKFPVKVHFQVPETYTLDDYLVAVGSIKTSMSSVGGYEIGNASITLKNIDYYFSRKFTRELPNKRRVEIFLDTGYEEILISSGIVSTWQITPETLSLNANASLLDTLQLRDTSVYKNPRDISPLRVVYGDLTNSQVPCTQIDKDGRIHHWSDCPVQLISKVYVDGEPKTYGFKTYTAYQDETGKSIACIIFDEPQYEKKVSASGKGAIKLDPSTGSGGELIENPADLINVLVPSDAGEITRLYADCLKNEVKVAAVLDNLDETIKTFLDELALNIHSHWLISDNKSVMRLRNYSTFESPEYHFFADEITEFSVTSEELINEVTINYAYDFSQGKFQSSITKHNPLSKVLYGTVRQTFDLKMVQTTRQAERVVDSILMTYSIPGIVAEFKHDYRSIHIEVGDVCTISHLAGTGENGFDMSRALVIEKDIINSSYKISLEKTGSLYSSELLNLTQVAGAGTESISITYEQGVATITIYADIQGSPPVEGAEVTIAGVRKITDNKGQARFNLLPGTYKAYIQASGYEDAEITFSV